MSIKELVLEARAENAELREVLRRLVVWLGAPHLMANLYVARDVCHAQALLDAGPAEEVDGGD